LLNVKVQSRLIDLMSSVATPRTTSSESKSMEQLLLLLLIITNKFNLVLTVIPVQRTNFDEACVKDLEELIDLYDSQLPKLTQFILPVSISYDR
jgi:cob(I)alamin adenosyltransferase